MKDDDLLARAQRGEPEAVQDLLAQLAPKLKRFGRQLCTAYADDALQESLLTIAEQLPNFRGEAELGSWAYTIVRSACRKLTRGKVMNNSQPLSSFEEPKGSANPEGDAILSERKALFNCALQALPDSLREVLLLRDVEELSAQEAARALAISVPALKSRLHRARAALSKELERLLSRDGPRAECPDVLSALSQQREGSLPHEASAKLDAHLSTCPQCARARRAFEEAILACRECETSAEVQGCVDAAVRHWRNLQAAPSERNDDGHTQDRGTTTLKRGDLK